MKPFDCAKCKISCEILPKYIWSILVDPEISNDHLCLVCPDCHEKNLEFYYKTETYPNG